MISKELLSEVLELNIVCVSNFLRKDNMLEYQFLSSRNKEYGLNNAVDEIIYPPRQINIYELAHECKQWAFKYRYMIDSSISPTFKEVNNGIAGTSLVYNLNNMESKRFQSDTEPEAIFKACEWILDNKDNK